MGTSVIFQDGLALTLKVELWWSKLKIVLSKARLHWYQQ